MIERKQGNMLEAQAEALVNTVNTVGVMGKGIALQFKKAYPASFKPYKAACDAGTFDVGQVMVFDSGALRGPRYIVHFPTKKHWRSKSQLAWITSGLEALVREVKNLSIASIALPPLGCGLGGLDWNDVFPLIERAFADLSEVQVQVFEPAGAPAAAAMPNRTARPKMTLGRAVILELMKRYRAPGFDYRLSLLEIQKLAYFQRVAGEPFAGKLHFTKHHYGPYADTLRHVLEKLDGHFIRGYGDGDNKRDTPIDLVEDAAAEADRWVRRPEHADTLERFDRVTRLIEGFESPYGMELLGSVHWVATHEADPDDLASVTRGVHAWSDRKASLMKPAHIRAAWQTLKDHGWLDRQEALSVV